ncbi:MAG: Nif11-like leader peptide family RiPP precursor [Arenicellales bacterium]
MSKANLDQFVQKVTDSEELQTRIGEEIGIDSLIALGAEHGFEFTAEDLAENVELSDEELDGVAGGAFANDVAGSTKKGNSVQRGSFRLKLQDGSYGEQVVYERRNWKWRLVM